MNASRPESTFGTGQNTARGTGPARRAEANQASFALGTPYTLLPGAAAKADDLVRRAGWNAASIGLRGIGEGGYVVAPPTRVGGVGAVQWARTPTTANRWLPEAEELIGPLAYACGRAKADARQ